MARSGISIDVRADTRRLRQLVQQYPQAADEALAALALEGKRIAQMSMNTSPPGRSYKRRGGRVHIASQPGQPPNIDMGNLMNGMTTYRKARLRYAISAGQAEYALYLEFGTRRMAARPFMRPMAAELRQIAARTFRRLMRVR